MVTANINTKQINDIISKINSYKLGALKRADDVLATGALLIESSAKELASVDTGLMRSSVAMIKENVRKYKVSCNVSYAMFIEFGTVKMGAKPFMFPAYLLHRDKIIADLAAAIKPK